MLGDVVELEATQDATGLCGREGLIEGSGGMGRQVVLHHPDLVGVRKVDVDEVAQALSIVARRAALGEADLAPRSMDVENAPPASSRTRPAAIFSGQL
jgi:hypothetical protein